MLEKIRSKPVNANSKAKKGIQYVCDSCGFIVTVNKACSCNSCNIICWGQNMKILTSS